MKQRVRIQRLKVRILRNYFWWIPYNPLIHYAADQGISIDCGRDRHGSRFRWWVTQYRSSSRQAPSYTRLVTCGSMRTAIATLKLASGWGGNDDE